MKLVASSSLTRLIFGSICAVSLSSCGGGGSSSPSAGPTNQPPVATAPSFSSAATVAIVENTANGFYTAAATDPQGDAITFSVFAGPDAGSFVMENGGVLRFNEPPNYDLLSDVDGNNIYEVTLRATAGGESDDLALRVTATNDREGVVVTRVATGFVDPVAISFVHNEPTLLVAEAGGAVKAFDPDTGTITEDTFIRDNKVAGEIIAMAYGFPGNFYQEGTYILTHSPQDGLFLQAFKADANRIGQQRLGDPWATPTTASIIANGSMFIAIGSPEEGDAQDASSPYGKLIELQPFDPYSGASLPSPNQLVFRSSIIGDGVQRPGGFSPEFGRIYLADQGSSLEHEISIFQTDWRPLDFGWPFYEGSQSTRVNPPAQINGPTLTYTVGSGPKEGSGVIAGLMNDENFFPALGRSYIFADTSGTIWSVPYSTIIDGFRHDARDFEIRNEDFAPDQGTIDSPVGFTIGFGSSHFYILDSDGEIFRVGQS